MAIMRPVNIPRDIPRIGMIVRIVDGVPFLFTERGELVDGQTACSVHAAVDSVVVAKVELHVTKPNGD